MKKIFCIYILAFFLLFILPAHSQDGKLGGQIEAGYGFGISENYNSAQIFLTPLYKQNDRLSFGIGVGYKYLYRTRPIFNITEDVQRLHNFPMYAVIQYDVPTRIRFRPFVNMKIGYGISSRKVTLDDTLIRPIEGKVNLHTTGGFFVSPAIGMAYPINDQYALQLSLAYDLQRIGEELSNEAGERYSSASNYDNVTVRLGFNF